MSQQAFSGSLRANINRALQPEKEKATPREMLHKALSLIAEADMLSLRAKEELQRALDQIDSNR